MTKVLSIIVPSYNVEDYLNKGLATYGDESLSETLEVLIVNDGSTDSTPEIAQDYIRRFPQIFRLITKENGGHGSAINAGIATASGKYLRVIDGDDWVITKELTRLIEYLQCSETDLVIDVKTEVDKTSGACAVFPLPQNIPLQRDLLFDETIATRDISPFIMIHTLILKRDYLSTLDFTLLEHTFYVDYEFIVKATAFAKSISFCDTTVYQYLVGNATQSVSDQNYVKRWADHTRVTEEILFFTQKALDRDDLSAARKDYLSEKALLLIHTHYKIALIFDPERKRGKERARAFRDFLSQRYPKFAGATQKRYRKTLILHYLGLKSQSDLDRLR